MKFCSKCGVRLGDSDRFCYHCGYDCASPFSGTQTQNTPPCYNANVSRHSGIAALVLCICLGTLGIHRFYIGRVGTGILMLLTLGGFGIWVLIDFILLLTNGLIDGDGKRVIL